ncbi:MAG: hypothetical protein K0R76_355 [Alphaproteobacteria bacterium]|jgi:anti-anti-sigma regulatory factor|nr:hypothetical protein [Alphaproteobacteria bacterium]MDF3033401.1 hypothetical protein [Alphaproteobacteria bacterium]
MVELDMQDTQSRLILDGALCKSSVAELSDLLHKSLEVGKPLLLQAKKVEQIDTTILQMLLGFMLAVKKKNIPCKWDGASSTFRQSVEILGLSSFFNFGEG